MASLLTNRCRSLPDTLSDRRDRVDGSMADVDEGGNTEIQVHSIRCFGEGPLITETTNFHNQLINIAEEMGDDDFDLLKFLCRDHITVSKLEAASTALDVFESLKKSVIIDSNNVDFLLECFVRMHRLDLVKKLGLDPRLVKQQQAKLKGLFPFRILLLDIAEDITDTEFETLKFLLSGRIKKKTLQDKKTLLGLFLFMERDMLLSDDDLDLLGEMMAAINRGDLVDIVNQFKGVPTQRRPGQITQNTNVNNPTTRLHGSQPPPVTSGGHPGVPRGDNSSRIVPTGSTDHPPRFADRIERSPSAETLSVPSGESGAGVGETTDTNVTAIPEPIFLQIANDLKVMFDDLGIELGYCNAQLVQLNQEWPDTGLRTQKLLRDWMTNRQDPGQVAPGLHYTLQRLGCKQSESLLKRWMEAVDQGQSSQGQRSEVTESLNKQRHRWMESHNAPDNVNLAVHTGEAQQTVDPHKFQPAGPHMENNYTSWEAQQTVDPHQFQPAGPTMENNYTSLRAAQVYVPPSGDAQNGLQHHRDTDDIQRQLQQLNLTDEERSRQLLANQQLSIAQLASFELLASHLGNQQLPGQPLPVQSLPGQPLPGQSSIQQLSHGQYVSGVVSTALRQQATIHPIMSQPNITNPASHQALAKPTPPEALSRYRMDRKPRGEAQQAVDPYQYQPAGPPMEKNYTSLRAAQVYVPPSGDSQKGLQHHRDTDDIQRQLQQLNLTDDERSRQLLANQQLSIAQLARFEMLASHLGNQQLLGQPLPLQSLPGQPLPGQSSIQQLSHGQYVSGVVPTALRQQATIYPIMSQPKVMNPASRQAPAKPTPPEAFSRYRMDRKPRVIAAQVYVPPSGDAQKGRQHHRDTDEIQRQLQLLNLTDVERRRQLLANQQLSIAQLASQQFAQLASQQFAQLVSQLLGNKQLPGQPLPVQSLPGQPLPGQSSIQQLSHDQSVSGVAPTALRQQATIHPILSQPNITNPASHQALGKPTLPEALSRYRMDRKPRELINATFTAMNFTVIGRDNLSNTDMMGFLVDIAHNVDHAPYDCFACFILTHGVHDSVYGSNGCTIFIKDLTRTYQANRCKSLTGKPKLFFIQACQGTDTMEGGEIERDGPTTPLMDAGVHVNQPPQGAMIPNESDYLLGYSTFPGLSHGSWYIHKLCQMLERYTNSEDLMSILVKVNEEVSNANAKVEGGIFKQTPAPMVTLRKKLFFS